MEEGQRRELRRWAEQLRTAPDREKRAAGRAILLLIQELESATGGPPPQPPAPGPLTRPEAGDGALPAVVADSAEDARADADAAAARPQRRGRRRRGLGRLAIALGVVGGFVYGGLALGATLAAPHLDAFGPKDGARVGPALLPRLSFAVSGSAGALRHARWKLDGLDVTSQSALAGGRSRLDGSKLPDGSHTVSVSVAGGFPGARTMKRWRFAIDTTGPRIRLDPPAGRIPAGKPLRLSGTLEPGATLTVNGRPAAVTGTGRFSVAFAARPTKPVLLAATDTLRNTSRREVSVLYVPRRPPTPVRAVHVTFYAWSNPKLRRGILDLIAEDRINAVELDLKDEAGTIGFDAGMASARRIGATRDVYDLAAAVKLLHAKGVRVIGRLVCFRDPIYAKAAWAAGRRDEVIQTPDGGLYGGYGGFTNFASLAVQRYQIAVAVAAAKAGVDDILYDYVRRPDGPLSSMVFPGLRGTPEQAIARFLARSRAALEPYHVFLGASVFGVAATRPEEVAQDIPLMASHVDYIAPMVYPSHWSPGEYGVAEPNSQPYDIVRASLLDFENDVRGTGARVVPWLQDFSLGVTYGAKQVDDQIRAARDDGIDEFLLWDPLVTYTAGALTPDARKATFSATARTALDVQPTASPNELGLVPILMHHQVREGATGPYDLTPEEFRAELERLYRDGFVPVRAEDYVAGTMDVPKGKSPVVLTFDDADNNQVAFLRNGKLDPKSAVGIMEAFARTHSDFSPTATFFVLKNLFLGNGRTQIGTLRWLASHGFELANHTADHVPLNTLDPDQVQKELALGDRLITSAVHGAQVKTMALPEGALPSPSTLAVQGTWKGNAYHFAGVFLAGAEPAPSPYSVRFDPTAIPRIRTTHYSAWHGERDFTAGYWLDLLEKQPQLRYVSDGDAATISYPKSLDDELADRWRSRAKPY